MIYIDPAGNYPRHYGDIMNNNPGWQLNDPLPEGWQEVLEVDAPSLPENYNLIENYPVVVDGFLTRSYTIEPYSEDQILQKSRMIDLRLRLAEAGFTESEIFAIKNNLV